MCKTFWLPLTLLLFAPSLVACGSNEGDYQKNTGLGNEAVTLRLVGKTKSFFAMESVINQFENIYPNVSIEYEWLQTSGDKYVSTLVTRLSEDKTSSENSAATNDEAIDFFITDNIIPGSTSTGALADYALNLASFKDKIDLSDCYDGFIKNFTVPSTNELFAVPMGGEARGMFVNKSLLSELGLSVPTNYQEFLACCASLYSKGYTPIQGNPGSVGQLLMYPYCANLIANAADYEATYKRIDACEKGISEIFREPISRLYDLVKENYYNYSHVEDAFHRFIDGKESTAVADFLNLPGTVTVDKVTYDKTVGGTSRVAFLPQAMSFGETIQKSIEDNHLDTDYEFIFSPTGDNGGFCYMSPWSGLAVSRYSKHQDWDLEFFNFFFNSKINQSFASQKGILPNTNDAFDILKSKFSISADRASDLGQSTFSYNFYVPTSWILQTVSKANKQKYMVDNGDGTYSMHPLSYYMDLYENDTTNGLGKYRTTA